MRQLHSKIPEVMPEADNQQPLLEGTDVDAEPRRRVLSIGKVVGALLGSAVLVCLATTQSKGYIVPFSASFNGKSELLTCPNLKSICGDMILAKGPMEREMRSLPPFDHLVAGDIIDITTFKVVPGVEPSITFIANASLLSTLEASVSDGTLTVGTGCACDPQWPDPRRGGKITASIVSSTWPQSLRFRDASSGHFADLSGITSVSSEDVAGLYIGSVTGISPVIGCKGSAELELGSVQASEEVAFHAVDTCNLQLKTGSSSSSKAEITDAANVNLGSFTTKWTRVTTTDACSFAGQKAASGDLKATDVSYMATTLQDGGSATCSDMGYVGVTTAGQITSHREDLCSVEVTVLRA